MQSHITICLLYVTACNATKIPGVKVTFESLFWIADGQRLHITIYGVGCIIFVSWQKILSNMVKGGWFIGRNAALIGQWLLLTRWSSETWHMKKDKTYWTLWRKCCTLWSCWQTTEMVSGQLADTPTRGLPTHELDNLWTGYLADWSTQRLVNSWTGQVAD